MNLNFSSIDLKYYFERHKSKIIYAVIAIFVGIILAIIISLSSDSYLNLLCDEDNVFSKFVNGNLNFVISTLDLFLKNISIIFIVFLLCLYYKISYFSYAVLCYQTILFYLTSAAIISIYGFLGLIEVVFLMLPVNIVNLIFDMFIMFELLERSYESFVSKQLSFGFNLTFWKKITIAILLNFAALLMLNLILVLILKNNIFVLF